MASASRMMGYGIYRTPHETVVMKIAEEGGVEEGGGRGISSGSLVLEIIHSVFLSSSPPSLSPSPIPSPIRFHHTQYKSYIYQEVKTDGKKGKRSVKG